LLARRLYQPDPYSGFYITDPKLRHIHKASVRDRVLHHAIFRVLYPMFEIGFIHDSYACRIDRGSHRAVRRLATFAREVSYNYRQNVFALKCDVKKFFDTIDHEILTNLLAKKIDDPDCMWLLGRLIGSFETTSGKGIPIGNVTSQLFSNVYLNELDQFIKHNLRIKHYIRYCDDFITLHRDSYYLESLIPKFEVFLKYELNLSLHPRKISIRKLHQGVDFLGYVARPNHSVLRTRTKKRMFRKLEKAQDRLNAGEISKERFNQSFQSYLGLLRHCRGHQLGKRLENNFLTQAT
jgi:RNA-directed DNA polymerase